MGLSFILSFSTDFGIRTVPCLSDWVRWVHFSSWSRVLVSNDPLIGTIWRQWKLIRNSTQSFHTNQPKVDTNYPSAGFLSHCTLPFTNFSANKTAHTEQSTIAEERNQICMDSCSLSIRSRWPERLCGGNSLCSDLNGHSRLWLHENHQVSHQALLPAQPTNKCVLFSRRNKAINYTKLVALTFPGGLFPKQPNPEFPFPAW